MMFSTTSALAALLSVIAFSAQAVSAAPMDPAILELRSPPTGFIVKFRDNSTVTPASRATWLAGVYANASLVMSASTKDSLKLKWNTTIFDGLSGSFGQPAVDALRANANVLYVVPDKAVFKSVVTTSNTAPWGLQRISQRGPLANKNANAVNFVYTFDDSAGEGVDVYVLDTGVRVTHSEFGGRATFGATFGDGTPGQDVDGHGTHCAGTIAGATVGVAPKASIIGVKVLGDTGSGTNSDIISGINFVAQSAAQSGKPSVISMSLGGGASAPLDAAVRNAIASGIHFVLAAGNEGEDANGTSPARVQEAITVGASDINDEVASFSNFGPVVDIFAPGVAIISASSDSDTGLASLSGTSMATPHVAGLAAYLLALEGNRTPEELRERIKELGVDNPLTGVPAQTANDLAFNGVNEGN